MRMFTWLAIALCVGILPAQPIANGSFEFPNQLPSAAPVAPWSDGGAFNEIGPWSLIAPAVTDDGFPSSGAQWLFCTNFGTGPAAAAAPSGGGLHTPGTVGQVSQTFTADGSGVLSFDWTWITGEATPDPTYNDFASIDILDMAGNHVVNLLFIDTGAGPTPQNIPGATGGPAGPATFGPSGGLLGGTEVLPTGPKSAVYAGLGLPAGVQFQLVIVAGNMGDSGVESYLYVDDFQPNLAGPPPVNQPNTPVATLDFTGSSCLPSASLPFQKLNPPGADVTMTVSTAGNGQQPYSLFFTPGLAALSPGIPTQFGFVNLNLSGILEVVIDGIVPVRAIDFLLGSTGSSGVKAIPVNMPPTGTGTWGTFQAMCADPTNPFGITITAATQMDFATPAALPPAFVGTTPATWTAGGDDDTFQVVFTGPLSVPFYGATYSDVWINSNGSISFGAGDTGGYPASSTFFLADPPRIAPMLDDLNPGAAGTVAYNQGSIALTVSWTGVPEYLNIGSNDFALVIDNSGLILMAWGPVSAADGGVGITPGLSSPVGAATGASIDLTSSVPYTGAPSEAIFQVFSFANPFDLNYCLPAGPGSTLTFAPSSFMTIPGDNGYIAF